MHRCSPSFDVGGTKAVQARSGPCAPRHASPHLFFFFFLQIAGADDEIRGFRWRRFFKNAAAVLVSTQACVRSSQRAVGFVRVAGDQQPLLRHAPDEVQVFFLKLPLLNGQFFF